MRSEPITPAFVRKGREWRRAVDVDRRDSPLMMMVKSTDGGEFGDAKSAGLVSLSQTTAEGNDRLRIDGYPGIIPS